MDGKVKQPNEKLRYQRELRGWSQQKLAELLGTNMDRVSRWECGDSVPSPHYREKLVQLFRKSAKELGIIQPIQTQKETELLHTDDRSSSSHLSPNVGNSVSFDKQENTGTRDAHMQGLGEQEMNKSRRLFFHQALGVAIGTALVTAHQELLTPEPWERLSMALAKPSSMEVITLTHLETITQSYWQLRAGIASRDLLKGILGHLQTVTTLLQNPQSPGTRKHLCSIAAEIAQVAGQMLFDMNDYSSARAYYKVSMEAAQEAENNSLYAVALGRMSFLPIYDHKPQDALILLGKAYRLAENFGSARIRSWLSAVEAEAEAKAAEADGKETLAKKEHAFACLQALEKAERGASVVTSSDDDSYWTGFDQSRLAGYRGICHIRLGQPEAAMQALNEALIANPTSHRRRSTLLTDLAVAHVQQGEIEEACRLVNQALTITVQTKSSMVLQRIHDFRMLVQPWNGLADIRDLDEQLLLL